MVMVTNNSLENLMHEPRLPLWSRSVATALALSLGLSACNRHADTLVTEARQYRESGDSLAAVMRLKTAIGHDAAHRNARSLLGAIYLDQGEAALAENELRRALALGADIDSTMLLLARSLLLQGHYTRLLEEIPAPGPQGRAILFALRGHALQGLARGQAARDSYMEALRRDTDCSEALLGLAQLSLNAGSVDLARAQLSRALVAHPADLDSLRFKGELMRMRGKRGAAFVAYRKILALRPDDVQALIAIARLHADIGDFAAARKDLAQARKASANPDALLYPQALIDYREGKHADALLGLRPLLSESSRHEPAQLLARMAHAALGANDTQIRDHQPSGPSIPLCLPCSSADTRAIAELEHLSRPVPAARKQVVA
jgi:Tfp pilus assembly protein PilF